MSKITLFLLFIVFTISTFSQDPYKAQITINPKPDSSKLSPYFDGAFIECVLDYVNGTFGLSAQELTNRGFDREEYEKGVSSGWMRIFQSAHPDLLPDYELNDSDMYNPNGVYSQKIINRVNNNLAGLVQETYFSDAGCDFYLYMKSSDNINVRIKIIDIDDQSKIYFDEFLGNPDKEWKKYELSIPENLQIYKAKLIIYFLEKGSVLIDEASLMPKDHINQIRKEYFDMYKIWKPSIIRFPGGTFADEEAAHWHYGIDEIDKRKSPNLYSGESQRFEIGINEFMQFCNAIDAEPQFVTNMKLGTPEESANLVEYLNGDENTYWGRKRVQDGSQSPYQAKYFEIGNEQWDDVISLANKFKAHGEAMKKIDPNIHLMYGGNLWSDKNFFSTSIDIAGSVMDSYGWHYLNFADINVLPDSLIFKIMMSSNIFHQRDINNFYGYREIKNKPNLKLDITEIWAAYEDGDWFFSDRLYSLENALFTADFVLLAFENHDIINIINQTIASGFFERGYSATGKRIIQGAPKLYAMQMLANHTGDRFVRTITDSPTFDLTIKEMFLNEQNIPLLRVVATIDDDSLYIAIINKDPEQDCIFSHNLEIAQNEKVKHYELYSENYTDRNFIEQISPIEIKEYDLEVRNQFTLKKHSFNIFAIPISSIQGRLDKPGSQKTIIFPNPTHSFINMNYLPVSDIRIVIYDMNGKLCLTQNTLGRSRLTLDIRNLQSGAYWLIFENSELMPHKLIISQ